MNRFFYLIFLALVVNAAAQTTITILHTNNINGTLENCLCTDHPLGSIEKIKPQVDSIRAQNPNVLFIDTGDFFSAFGDQEKDYFSLTALKLMGYDLLVPGDQEFSNGMDFFRNHTSKEDLPYISANISVNGVSEIPAYKTVKYNGIIILITSITAPDVFRFYKQPKISGVQVFEPEKKLIDILQKEEFDFFILLSHSGLEKDISFAETFPKIGLIIGGHSQDVLKEAQKVNNTYIVQAGSDGFYLGKVVLRFNVKKKLESCQGQLIPMHLNLPNDPRLELLAKEWGFKFISKYFKKGKQIQPLANEFVVVDPVQCAECHEKQYKSWQNTAHAHAWQSVSQKKKTKSMQCLSCHVSGFGRKEGFINENLTPEHMQVNCTDCHWTNENHFRDKSTESVRTVDGSVCLRCHDSTNDPDFNYEKDKQRVVH